MNIIKYLQDKKDELDSEVHLALQKGTDNINYLAGQMSILDEILLYARLTNTTGKVKYVVVNEWSLESTIDSIEDKGGEILDVQISAASPGISVSAGDRMGNQRETTIIESRCLIKYIEGPNGN